MQCYGFRWSVISEFDFLRLATMFVAKRKKSNSLIIDRLKPYIITYYESYGFSTAN